MSRGHPINFSNPNLKGTLIGTDIYESFLYRDKHRAPIVKVRCSLCNRVREVDGTALFRQDKLHLSSCECKVLQKYKDHIGELFGTDELIDVKGRTSDGQIAVKVKCILCGKEREIAGAALFREVGKRRKKSYKQCECLTHRFDYENYVGKLFKTDIIESFDNEKDKRGNYLVTVRCTLCGKLRKVKASGLIKGNENKLEYKLCPCVSGIDEFNRHEYKYEEYLNTVIGTDKIINYFRNEKNVICLTLECVDCGERRIVEGSRFLNPNEKTPLCSCKKELGYYKSFIGKTINDDKIIGLADRKDFAFRYYVECTLCHKKRIVFASKLLNQSEHLNKCDCKKKAYIYHKDDYINKTYGFLIVRDLINKNRQTYAICDCKCGNKGIEKPIAMLESEQRCSCGCIKTSFGEASIAKILQDNNIIFSREVKFKDLLSPKGGYLRYDFALWQNDNIICLIEFDGLQHIDVNYQFGVKNKEEALKQLKTIQFYDKLKDEYAIKHNIKLYRISYTRYYDEIEKQILNILKEKKFI